MTKRLLTITLLLLATILPSVFARAAERPNLVLIFIDDMGYGDVEPYGSTVNRTPNLNRMAAEGMKLTSFHAASVCSASRAQLMTGCYAPRVSVPGVFFPAGPQGLNPDETTVAEYLREQGYATTCVGKWHLGDQPEFLPTRQGFDHYFGILDEEIGELTNLADQNPEVVTRLQELADAMIADIGSGSPGTGVRPCGVVKAPVTLYPTQPRKQAKKATAEPID